MSHIRKRAIPLKVTFPVQDTEKEAPEKEKNIKNKLKRVKLQLKHMHVEQKNSKEDVKKTSASHQRVVDAMHRHLDKAELEAKMHWNRNLQLKHFMDKRLQVEIDKKKFYKKKCAELEQRVRNNATVTSFKCEICLLDFQEDVEERIPRILSKCGHTVCQGCAVRFLNDGFIRCPFDRITTPVTDVKQLKKNYILFSMQ